jgi:hypothetical protein
MNVGITTGLPASAAGAPRAQTAGAETERSQKDGATRERLVDSQDKSERASGIGTTDEDQQADDRDADGRRMWERAAKDDAAKPDEHADEPERRVKDPTGQTGNALDLTG